MMLLEPRAYSESQQIADYLKRRNAVVVNLKRVTPDQAKRIVDFLYGTIYAIDGDIQKLGGGIFLCTPNNVVVDGKISDEQQQAKPVGPGAEYMAEKEETEDDFF
ncbi:MAG: cell division protein SepF [Bacilli bacterium]|nr:cell division protein SepF [Bacilli bacterium]